MTAERAAKLEALGLVRQSSTGRGSDEATREAQLARLVTYKAASCDYSVQARWAEDPRLGSWVSA